MTTGLHRLWKLPLPYAVWLALPLQLIMIWVGHRGWVQYERNHNYLYVAEQALPFDLEQWRYFTQKELHRSIDLTFAPPVVDDGVEEIRLTIDRRHIGSLNSNLPESGKSKYYRAEIEFGGQTHRVKTRYVGDNHWHWLYPQKSWKIKTRSGDPIRDRKVFFIKNTPTPVFEDHVANQIAAEIGLIVPDVRPVKLFVNGAYSGVFHWQDVADESVLRRFRRMPGSIYSGDGVADSAYDQDGVSQLFSDQKHWPKVASRNADQLEDRSDIEALIVMINHPDPKTFRAFADDHIDLEQFAKFTALDRLLGGEHHDYTHNHKIYFDPYKGRFEPIAWDLAWWLSYGRIAGLDQCLNPMLIRIREQPELELLIQRALLDLCQRYPPDEIDARIDRAAAMGRRALAADGFRDVREHTSTSMLRLGQIHSCHFSMTKFEADVYDLKLGYLKRYKWLGERLADSALELQATTPVKGTVTLNLRSSGLVGQQLRQLTATTSAPFVDLIRDRNRNGVIDPDEQPIARVKTNDGAAVFALQELVLPGLKKDSATRGHPSMFGTFTLVPSSLRYSYFVRPSVGRIDSVELRANNAVTGEEVTVEVVGQLSDPEPNISFHPWDLPPPPPESTVKFGPGEVTIDRNVLFGSETSITIQPGTTMRLAPDISIEIRGKITAKGTADKPIRFLPTTKGKPWGVFALHGKGTKGSSFSHCEWRDGSTAKLRMVLRTGMVSIIDTEDITLRNCYIGKNHLGDDALHFGYVTGGEVRECEFEGARSDAFDLDITEDVRIIGCVFHHSGNDALDLMTSKVEVTDCHFHDTGDKGISVGEATTLHLLNSKFERCVIGLEIKDKSIAHVDSNTRLIDCQTGVNLNRKNTRYTNGGTIIADDLWVINSPQPLIADKRSTIHVGKLHTTAAPN